MLKAKILLSELNQYYISNDEAKKEDLLSCVRINSKLMDINKYMPGSDLIEKRYEDLEKASSDSEYQKQLMKKYNIIK